MTLYYTGDVVPLKFTISDAEGAVNPSAVNVIILKPGNEVTEATAAIDGNEVSYTVPPSVTQKDGHYKAYFVCTLTAGERTHKIEFDITRNPGG